MPSNYIPADRLKKVLAASNKPTPEMVKFRRYCESKGWAVYPDYVSTVDDKPTGYLVHGITVKDLYRELEQEFGAKKDAKQYKGHVNLTTDKGTLMQVQVVSRGMLLSLMFKTK